MLKFSGFANLTSCLERLEMQEATPKRKDTRLMTTGKRTSRASQTLRKVTAEVAP